MCERTISVTLLAALLLLPSCATKQTPYIPEETPPEDRHEEAPPGEPDYDSSLDLPPESAFSGYPGDPLEIPFSLVEGSDDAKVVIEGEGAPELSFDSTTGEGTVAMTFPDTPGTTCQATVTLTDVRKTCQYAIRATSYLFSVTAEAVSLEGGKGSSAFLEVSCETDIPGCELVYIPSEGFAVENGYVVALTDNDTPYPRTGSVLITESTRHFVGTTVTVTQEPLPPAPGPDVVAFSEWPMKLAMVEIADSDGDGEVSFEEALSVSEIVAAQKGIRDLTGLEAFRNAWKVDLRGNDIEDATVLRELPLLHWLDLRGNPRLRTFDVTGCSQYFEHCEFEVTEDLLYYTYRQQTGVTSSSDPSSLYSVHVVDSRKTSDWSSHGKMTLVRAHTREITKATHPWIHGPEAGPGRNQEHMVPSIVFTGLGYLDVDITDGSWERQMREALELCFMGSPIEQYIDYYDIYFLTWLVEDRNRYYHPEELFSSPGRQEVAAVQKADQEELFRYCYEALYGDTTELFEEEYPTVFDLHTPAHPPQMVVTVDCNPYKTFQMQGLPIAMLSQSNDGKRYRDYHRVQYRAMHTTHAMIGATPDGIEVESYYNRYSNWAETLEDLFINQNPDKAAFQGDFLRYCSIVE